MDMWTALVLIVALLVLGVFFMSMIWSNKN